MVAVLAGKWCQTEVSPQNQGRPRRYCSPEWAKQAASREKREQHRSIKGWRKVRKVLPCLKCGQAFTSLGPGNRLSASDAGRRIPKSTGSMPVCWRKGNVAQVGFIPPGRKAQRGEKTVQLWREGTHGRTDPEP